ncbi:MAG: LPS export ABC transporter periplasmic protein LptC [Gammaproteobacteria bacterium]|nr:LPS export ABC transporter periplasmic protein LptC [Gammaproteobacteria bacterium]
MLTLKNISISILLILAISLSAWSILLSNTQTSNETIDPKQLDGYMQDVTAILLNKEGMAALKLVTPKMIHYPQDDTTDIQTPRVTFFRKSPQPWFIDADFAKSTHGINEILFWSHVDIHHPSDIENPKTTLQTESLTIYPEQQIAKTDLPVTFIQPDTIVHGVGMLADLNLGTIQLLSKTQGEYGPTS